MIKIKFENANGEETKFDPIGAIKNKVHRYYDNPNELAVDGAIVLGASLVLERMAYTLNAVTRAKKNFTNR